MPQNRKTSIGELREKSERNREALATTVGELRERVGDTATELKTLVSPAHIKQEITDYMRGETEGLIKAVKRRTTENPLQMAAVGVFIAYPAWRLLRALPTPLLFIGAGLFLTSKKGQKATTDATAKFGDIIQQGAEQVGDVATGIRSDLEDRLAGARYGAEQFRDTVSSAAEIVADQTRAKIHDARDAAMGFASAIANRTSETADRAADAATAGLGEMKGRTATAATNSANAVVGFVNDNALLIAGVGAAIGAFIAASIPASEAENRLFGVGSGKVKDQARNTAAQGIEMASDLAAEAASSVAAAATREGLDATGVRQTLNSVADSVRAVADRGIDTALGSTPQPNEQVSPERNPL